MKNQLNRALRGLAAVLLSVALLIALWQFAARFFFGQKLPTVLGYAGEIVLSGSMEPAISTGDLLVIRREKDYQTGDIISFWSDGTLVTHRLVEQTSEGLVTKGDHNNAPDRRPVQSEQIAGRVVWRIPWLGNVLLFLRTPPGMLLFLAAGGLGLFLPDWLRQLRNHRKGCAK